MNMKKEIFIVLQDGHIFKGYSFGAKGSVIGEIVFTTGMLGYIETLTDTSYYGQIVMQTFPLIGNYGINAEDCKNTTPQVKGYIVREWCEKPSNFRSEETLDEYLKKNNIVGVYGVDTREITQIIREHGVMNATIVESLDKVDKEKIKNYKITGAVEALSVPKQEKRLAENGKYKVTLVDYGTKEGIIELLNQYNCDVTVMPATSTSEEIMETNPDGIVLSNGAGDPSENVFQIEQIKKLIGACPIFGICLGHQLLALAKGAKIAKLKYGHRGANQPVKNLENGKTFISNQNHGYTVLGDKLTENGGRISYINANDYTCEGIEYPGKKAFSIQYLPDNSATAKETKILFEKFTEMMGGQK